MKIFVQDDSYKEILIPSEQLKIYASPDKDKVGPNPDQYRDCIDIAVKIALGLNQLKKSIDVNEIGSLALIKEITNQKKLNDSLFFNSEKAIARIRQASDDSIRMKANKILGALDKQRKSILVYSGQDTNPSAEKILEQSTFKFNNTFLPTKYESAIAEFQQLFQANNILFKNYMDGVEVSLQGQIDNE